MNINNSVELVMLSPFRKFVKEREFSIKFEEGETFKDLINKMIKEFGKGFGKTLINENNEIYSHISVMKNGTNISARPDYGFSEPLKNNQKYVFCAFISGG